MLAHFFVFVFLVLLKINQGLSMGSKKQINKDAIIVTRRGDMDSEAWKLVWEKDSG